MAEIEISRGSSLSDQVYDVLRTRFRQNIYRSGERMTEVAIAQELKVSRTPVREALFRLTADGLLEEARAGRFMVSSFSIADVRQIFEIRQLLEPSAFAQVARDADATLDAEASQAAQLVEAARDQESAADANTRFRSTWLRRVANGRLQQTILKFNDQVSLVRGATLSSPEAREDARDGVLRLTETIHARDEASARSAMVEFVTVALGYFEASKEGWSKTRNDTGKEIRK
ncbi:GntR family transcriptional regulator [Tropicimonas sp. IMCC34011]|uniref:GntR family transcriptional regulator n=1 Tax=Tropicimonas sp. IMCC34011 TaxID=2248759 RepID=UPI000E24F510|nr:GntR family transcriptional regulator [Tropicimonas sp. IMCC34011]